MSRSHTYFWPSFTGILFALCLWLWLDQQHPSPYASYQSISFAPAVNKAKRSVASINTQQIVAKSNLRQTLQNQQGEVRSSLGSAVIVDSNGYLLTNHHVIAGADQIIVTLYDGRQARAKVVGTDEESDLAVLWIDLDQLSPIVFSNQNRVQVGDIVLAIGNPFGFGHTVTQGIISATGRWGLNLDKYEDYLQTDADINVGNSGGALINTDGELVGINSAIYSQSGKSQGIGLAIPADLAERIMQELIQQGEVIRGWMGIGVQEITPDIAAQLQLQLDYGVLVTGVAPAGPAGLAGMQAGDILMAIDGHTLASGRAGMMQVAALMPGSTIMVDILRDNMRLQLPIIVGRKPSQSHP